MPIALIADNAKIHSATDVGVAAEILNIEFVFLPAYSPDLNPIEDLWKIIKSKVYLSNYNTLDELIDICYWWILQKCDLRKFIHWMDRRVYML